MENDRKNTEVQPGAKRSVLPILWGIILLCFVVVSFTGMTALGGFLTYSFAFLFGTFFPVVLVLLAIVALLLIIRRKVLEKGNRIFVTGAILLFLSMLALGSSARISEIPDFVFPQFLDIFLDDMSEFSDKVFQVQNYAAFGSLGGGFLGTFLFALFASFMKPSGALALFVILLLCGLFLVLAKPVKDLVLMLMGKRSSKVVYTSPFQDKKGKTPKVVSKKKQKEEDEIDPELTKPFSDSWYRDEKPAFYGPSSSSFSQQREETPVPREKEEDTVFPQRAAFGEQDNLLKGFRPAPSAKPVYVEERKTTPIEDIRKEQEKQEGDSYLSSSRLASREFLSDRSSDHDEEASSNSFLRREAPMDARFRFVQEKREEPVQEASVAQEPALEREEAEEREIEEKIVRTVPVFRPEPEPELVQEVKAVEEPAPKLKKSLPLDLEEQASRRAKDFRESSLKGGSTFEVLHEEEEERESVREDPLVLQAKSLKDKKVIEDHPHEFLVESEEPEPEPEPEPPQEDPEEVLEQRYFEIRRKKIEEENEKKRREEEERKAKVYKYVSPTNRRYDYALPDDALLEERDDSDKLIVNNQSAQEKAKVINKVFNDFRIQAKAISFTIGASVTRFNIQTEPGVRSEKISSVLSELQIALNGDKSVRIETVVEGRTTSGIEIGNAAPMAVSFKEAFQEIEKHPESNLLLPIGKDISGQIVTYPLDQMPHLLVAGTTGSGKSVLVHSFIMTLIMRNYPSQLKLMLIDPKQVEFAKYNLESHLYCPVISDANSAIVALQKLCDEMDRRYSVLKQWECVKMSEYRAKRKGREDEMEEMPDVVCVIDEFADLIMTAGKEVETPIARIAQLARAVGIHMIIATQRPSTNVITGLIKANFPARIAFKVASMIDSRTILDSPGANQLIGRGDMLISVNSEMVRVQCAFVDTPEVDAITRFIAKQQAYPTAFLLPEYVPENENGGGMSEASLGQRDEYFEAAARLIVSTQQGSTSAIQRRFSIGYNRAGRIMDQLEAAGIVGPFEGSKPRQVLVSDEYTLEKMLSSRMNVVRTEAGSFNGKDGKAYTLKAAAANSGGAKVAPAAPGTNNTTLFFNDGIMFTFQDAAAGCTKGADGTATVPNSCYGFIDVNGIKRPNTYGRDVFVFDLSESGNLIPRGIDDWKDDPLLCGVPGNKESVLNSDGDGCAARIIENGWVMDY